MSTTLKTALVALIVFGSASLVRADDGTDQALDFSRSGTLMPGSALKSSKVSLPRGQAIIVDRAGASFDNGGN